MKVLYTLVTILTLISASVSASAKTVILDTDGNEIGRIKDDGTITNGTFEIGEIDNAVGIIYDSAGGVMGYDQGGKILNAGYQVLGYYDADFKIKDADRSVIAVLKDDGAIVNDANVEVARWKGKRDARAVAVFAFFFNRFI
jgi:hypothetical protein